MMKKLVLLCIAVLVSGCTSSQSESTVVTEEVVSGVFVNNEQVLSSFEYKNDVDMPNDNVGIITSNVEVDGTTTHYEVVVSLTDLGINSDNTLTLGLEITEE